MGDLCHFVHGLFARSTSQLIFNFCGKLLLSNGLDKCRVFGCSWWVGERLSRNLYLLRSIIDKNLIHCSHNQSRLAFVLYVLAIHLVSLVSASLSSNEIFFRSCDGNIYLSRISGWAVDNSVSIFHEIFGSIWLNFPPKRVTTFSATRERKYWSSVVKSTIKMTNCWSKQDSNFMEECAPQYQAGKKFESIFRYATLQPTS